MWGGRCWSDTDDGSDDEVRVLTSADGRAHMHAQGFYSTRLCTPLQCDKVGEGGKRGEIHRAIKRIAGPVLQYIMHSSPLQLSKQHPVAKQTSNQTHKLNSPSTSECARSRWSLKCTGLRAKTDRCTSDANTLLWPCILAVRAALRRSLLSRVLMREAYSDALELTEAIYELCHHISDPGVLKLHVPHPLESLIWPPVIPHPPRVNPPQFRGL